MIGFTDDEDNRPDHFTRDDDGGHNGGSARRPLPPRDPDDPFAPADCHAPQRPQPERSRRHPLRRAMATVIFLVACGLAIGTYIRWFCPYADSAQETGTIAGIERRGLIFKTFEGVMVTNRSTADTTVVYQRDFRFSVADDSLAAVLQDLQGTGRQVRVEFERYHATVPWRGESQCVVTGVTPR